MDRILWYLCFGSRGGPTRIRILKALLDEPHNTNQLARRLGLDYKTVEYNLRVLRKHNIVVQPEDSPSYGALFEPSKNLLADREDFVKAVRDRREESGKRKNSDESEEG